MKHTLFSYYMNFIHNQKYKSIYQNLYLNYKQDHIKTFENEL
jgi:hypothetical protein